METLDFLRSDGSLGVGLPASQGFNPASDLVKGCLLVVRMPSNNENELTVYDPARYCIQVIGFLDEIWSDRLGGLTITSSYPSEEKAITTLTGTLRDQAALFGVLNALYDMRMPILSVKYLD